MQLFDIKRVNKHWRNNLILLICILVLFIIGPSLDIDDRVPFISIVFFTSLIVSGIFVIEYLPIIRKTLFIIGVLVIVIIWLDYLLPNNYLRLTGFLFLSIFLFAITISLIVHVAVSKDVNANIIFSAINGYLLLGIIGGISFLALDLLTSNAVLSNAGDNALADYMYFSYVTVTTLGYGDLTPITPGSRVLAMLLSISGQLYIAILVAMLVGKYLSKPNSK